MEQSNRTTQHYLYDGDVEHFKELLVGGHCKTYQFGDILRFSEYRDIETYFVGKNGELIPNPDNHGSGYLSIPFEITKYLEDALKKYPDDIEYYYIALRHDDEFLKNKGTFDGRFEYTYEKHSNQLHVNFPNQQYYSFYIDSDTPKAIALFYENSLLPKTYITTTVNLVAKPEDFSKDGSILLKSNYINTTDYLSNPPNINKNWTVYCDFKGGSFGSYLRSEKICLEFQGPTKYKDSLIQSIKDYYSKIAIDYSIDIE